MPVSLATPNTLANHGKKNHPTTRTSRYQNTQTAAPAYADQDTQANLVPPTPSPHSLNTQTSSPSHDTHASNITPIPSAGSPLLLEQNPTTPTRRKTPCVDHPLHDNDEPLLHRMVLGDADRLSIPPQQKMLEPNTLDSEGNTVLHTAIFWKRSCDIELLISYQNIDINRKNTSGLPPLAYAVLQGQADIVKTFLQSPVIELNSLCGSGHTALHYATSQPDTLILNLLLADDRVDPNQKNSSGYTPLPYSVTQNFVDSVASMLQSPYTDVNTAYHNGLTALHFAVKMGYTQIVRLLLSRPDTNPQLQNDSGDTPLHFAVSSKHFHIVKPLIKHTPSLITAQNREKMTALHYAVLEGDIDTAKILVNSECLKMRNALKQIPLHLAITAGHMELVLLLIPSSQRYVASESPVSNRVISHHYAYSFKKAIARTVHGNNALHLSVCHGHRDIAAVLLKLSPTSLNTPNNTGDTALHLAAYHGLTALVDLLLAQSSIQIHRTNGLGHTALDLAVNQQHDDTAEMLRTALKKETRLSSTAGEKAPALAIFTDSPATKQKSHAPLPVCLKTPDKLNTTAQLFTDKENRAPKMNGLPQTSSTPAKPSEHPSCLQDPVGEEPCQTTATSFRIGDPILCTLPGEDVHRSSEYWSQQFFAYNSANNTKRPSSEQRNEIERPPKRSIRQLQPTLLLWLLLLARWLFWV